MTRLSQCDTLIEMDFDQVVSEVRVEKESKLNRILEGLDEENRVKALAALHDSLHYPSELLAKALSRFGEKIGGSTIREWRRSNGL